MSIGSQSQTRLKQLSRQVCMHIHHALRQQEPWFPDSGVLVLKVTVAVCWASALCGHCGVLYTLSFWQQSCWQGGYHYFHCADEETVASHNQ